ncbi:hypothetical protein [Methylovirgula sp. 4M-Z18]|uniref:hypothetical protein n=1 Tax=Methylovirgula sp. 4M-Z18 TaxID=2293567 RepID=UPI000E2F6441|nr:hypothetical protein [Methylovirgula sp. 4M-Z18]RFB80963.1 hypothetical protein DYH55_05700 [Methylovirgula sp. 4M-Z18]
MHESAGGCARDACQPEAAQAESETFEDGIDRARDQQPPAHFDCKTIKYRLAAGPARERLVSIRNFFGIKLIGLIYIIIQYVTWMLRLRRSNSKWFRAVGGLSLSMKILKDLFEPEVLAACRSAFRDPAAQRAICEDYRAAAFEDRELDAADPKAGRILSCPVSVLWPIRENAGGPTPLDVLRRWADDVSGCAVESGHLLPEFSSAARHRASSAVSAPHDRLRGHNRVAWHAAPQIFALAQRLVPGGPFTIRLASLKLRLGFANGLAYGGSLVN